MTVVSVCFAYLAQNCRQQRSKKKAVVSMKEFFPSLYCCSSLFSSLVLATVAKSCGFVLSAVFLFTPPPFIVSLPPSLSPYLLSKADIVVAVGCALPLPLPRPAPLPRPLPRPVKNVKCMSVRACVRSGACARVWKYGGTRARMRASVRARCRASAVTDAPAPFPLPYGLTLLLLAGY